MVVSAIVAVITVLIGDFNRTASRVLFTLLMVIIHSLVSLVFIWDDSRQNTFERLALFTNVLFLLIVMSFITSVLGVWDVIPREFVWNLYQTYFVIGFASLHSDILSKALHKDKFLDIIVYLNYVFIGIVVLMLLPAIYIDDAFSVLGEVYFRFLGAAGIIDGTLSILAIIFYKLYMHKHPQEQNPLGRTIGGEKQRKGLSVWVWILIIYLVFQVLVPLIFWGGYWVFSGF